MTRHSLDLYGLLGVSSGASGEQLRKAYSWVMDVERSPARREEVRRAYAVLGDPRLRADYDRGRTVGVGINKLYQRLPASSTVPSGAARGRPPGSGSGSGSGGPGGARAVLERRWQHRWDGRARCEDVSASSGWRGVIRVLVVVVALSGTAAGAMQLVVQQGSVASGGAGSVTLASGRAGAAGAPAPPMRSDGAGLGTSTRGSGAKGGLSQWAAPGYRTGTCLAGDAHRLQPGSVMSCAEPHWWEVSSTVNLSRLLGHDPQPYELTVAGQDCGTAFVRYTGLREGTVGLSAAGVLDSVPGDVWNICLVTSTQPRRGSAAHLAQ